MTALHKPRTYCPSCGKETYLPMESPVLMCDWCWKRTKGGTIIMDNMTTKEAKALCKELRDAIEERIPNNAARCLAEAMLDRTEAHMLLAIREG